MKTNREKAACNRQRGKPALLRDLPGSPEVKPFPSSAGSAGSIPGGDLTYHLRWLNNQIIKKIKKKKVVIF